MCWSMWTEYRYCSPMSWIGQSLAAHSSAMAAMKQRTLRFVTTGCPAGTACGPTRFTM